MGTRGVLFAALVLAFGLVTGCTRERARIPLPRPSTDQTTASMDAGKVVFSLDAAFEAAAKGGGVTGLAAYKITIVASQGKKFVARTTCGPLRLASSGWYQVADDTRVQFTGRRIADCSLVLPAGGDTTFTATLSEVKKPDIRLHSLDLIIEQ